MEANERVCARVTLAGLLSAHRLDDSLRPVRLRKVVLGYPTSEQTSEFRFDLTLNYKLAGIIQTYSDQKPTLVVRSDLCEMTAGCGCGLRSYT